MKYISDHGSRYRFSVGEGLVSTLTHDARVGWHLVFSREGCEAPISASRWLALRLGESVEEEAEPISACREGEEVLLTASDGASVRISPKDGMCFLTPDGRVCGCLDRAALAGEELSLGGPLSPGVGVFGGGERLDEINQRGRVLSLYSSDGYNKSSTTYTVVPLFTTSEGLGLFADAYEEMEADFGGSDPARWRMTVKSRHLHLYVTVGGFAASLGGYTHLSGHAYPPSEWMHGVMICRSARDLSSFEVDRADYPFRPNGAPSGRSVKHLIGAYCDADMKPMTALLEPWGYSDITTSPERREETRQTVEWLHGQGMRVMLYIRAGQITPRLRGFTPERLLHADVIYTAADGSVRREEGITDIPRTTGIGNPDAKGIVDFDYMDITDPEAMDWFCEDIWGEMVSLGIDGVKIDFCEDLPDSGREYPMSDGGSRRVEYHFKNPDFFLPGTEHHAYPTYFISEFYRRMLVLREKAGSTDGFAVLSRGGGIGSQRSPYMWAGDQVRAYSKLDDQLLAVMTAGISGVPFMTFDMGGYHYGRAEDGDGRQYRDPDSRAYESRVFARAVEQTSFLTNIQTHGDVRNAFELEEWAQEIYRRYTALHELLTPLFRELSEEAARTGMPPVRHPVMLFPDDPEVLGLRDEYLLGDAFLVAPEWRGLEKRDIYLPAGEWRELGTDVCHDNCTGVWLRDYPVALDELPVFYRIGHTSRTASGLVAGIVDKLKESKKSNDISKENRV